MRNTVDDWLVTRFAEHRRYNVFVALGGVLLSGVIGFLTFWFIFALAWFIARGLPSIYQLFFGEHIRITPAWVYAAAGVFMLLLFVDALRHRSEPAADFTDEPPRHGLWRGGVVGALFDL